MARTAAKDFAGKTRAATKVEDPLEAFGLPGQALAEKGGHTIAELMDENILKGFGMLVEQRRDIGVARAWRRLFRAKACQPDAHAAMIGRIDGKATPIGRDGGGQIATALGREPFVIGLAESVFVEIGGPGISGVIVHTLFGCRVRRRDGSVGVGHGLVTHDHLFRA